MNLEPSDKQKQIIQNDLGADISQLGMKIACRGANGLIEYMQLEHCLYVSRQITFKLKLLAGYSPE